MAKTAGNFRALAEQFSEGILVHVDFKPVYVNQKLADLLGYKRPQDLLRLKSFLKRVAPHEHRRARKLKNDRLAGRDTPAEYDFEAIRRDGARIILNSRPFLIDWDGKPAIATALTDVTEERRRARVRALLSGTEPGRGSFLELAVEALAIGLGYKWAAVCEHVEDGTRARSLAFWSDSEIGGGFEYELAGTPCQSLIGSPEPCIYAEGVAARFPADAGLVERKAEAYRGQLLIDSNGNPMGHILAFDDKPDMRPANETFDIVAGWVATELERRQTIGSLEESREQYVLAMRGANESLWDWRVGEEEIYIDPRMLAMAGLPEDPPKIGFAQMGERVHPDDFGAFSAAFVDHLRSVAPVYSAEFRARDESGNYRWFMSRGVALRDADGRVTRVSGSVAEITERKEREQALRESERKFRDLAEGSLQGFLISGAKGRPLYANRAAATIFGYDDPEELLRLESFNVMAAAQERERLDEYRRMRMAGEEAPSDFEVECRRKDGSTVWVRNLVRITEWEGVPAVQSTVLDITERKIAELALRQSEDRFRDFARSGSDWFWEMDADLRFTEFGGPTPEFERMLGGERIGKTRWELVGGDVENDPHWAEHKALLEARAPFREFQYRIERPDLGVKHISVSGVPVFDTDGEFSGYRGTAADITRQVEAERQIASAEARFVEAMNGVPEGVALFDAEDRLIYFNDRYREIGWPIADIIERGLRFEDMARAVVERGFVKEAEGREEEWIEERMRMHRAPGAPFVMTRPDDLVEVREHRTAEGGTFIILADVTQRHRAAESLRESEARYRDLTEGSLQGILIQGKDTGPLYANQAAAKIFGYDSPEELLGFAGFHDLLPPHEQERLAAYRERRFAGGEAPTDYEAEGRRKDGSVVWFRSLVRVIEWDGAPALQIILVDVTERKLAAIALEDSEARYRDLTEGSLQGIMIQNQDGRPLYANQAAATIFGFDDPEDMLRRSDMHEHVAPRDRERLREYGRKRFAGGTAPADYEAEGRRVDGSTVWFRNLVRVINWKGERALQITLVDITERKLAELALRESEDRFRDFARSASDWFWEQDAEFKFTWFSEGRSDVNPDRGNIGTTRWGAAGVDPATDPYWAAHKADLEAHRPFRQFRYLADLPNFGLAHISVNGVPIFDDEGNFAGYRGTGSNVTREVEAERSAAAAERRFVDAMAGIPEGVALFDHDDRLVFFNEEFRRLSRGTEELIKVGARFEDIVRARVERGLIIDAQDDPEQWIADRIRLHRSPAKPMEVTLEDGALEIREHRMANGDTFHIIVDVSERKRTEAALREKDQRLTDLQGELFQVSRMSAMGQLSSAIAHELNQPLEAIMNFTQVAHHLVEDMPNGDEATGYMDRAIDQVERAATVVRRLRSFLQRGELMRRREDLRLVVEEAVSLALIGRQDQPLSLRLDLQHDLPAVNIDKIQIQQVTLNLVRNAVEAMEGSDRRELLVRASRANGGVRVDVRDTGPGLPDEIRANLFEPFMTTRSEGMGLGLSISRSIVEAHGGALNVHTDKGKGTTFSFDLPIETP